MNTPSLRPATAGDFPCIWEMLQAVIAAGDTYPMTAAYTEEQARQDWLLPRAVTYIAEAQGTPAGVCKFQPNQPGRGSHVANASFIVSPAFRGRGIGREMGEHILREARRAGYKALQFNYVVASNTGAVRLWKSLGFTIIGTVPDAFDHAQNGLTAVHIMHRFL